MADRTALTTGIAAASIAAVVAATPALITPPDQDIQVTASAAAALATKKLSVGDYRLLALSEITPQALLGAFSQGYGGIVTDGQVAPAGLVGVSYLVSDKLLDPGVQVDNYLFETGIFGAAGHVAGELGAPDLIPVFISDPAATTLALIVQVAQLVFGAPEVSPISGVVESFVNGYPFGDGAANAGLVGLANYLADQIVGALPSQASENVRLANDVQSLNVDKTPKLFNLDLSTPQEVVKKFEGDVDAAVKGFTAALTPKKADKVAVESVAVDGATGEAPEAPKFELPKLPRPGKVIADFNDNLGKQAKAISDSLKPKKDSPDESDKAAPASEKKADSSDTKKKPSFSGFGHRHKKAADAPAGGGTTE